MRVGVRVVGIARPDVGLDTSLLQRCAQCLGPHLRRGFACAEDDRSVIASPRYGDSKRTSSAPSATWSRPHTAVH